MANLTKAGTPRKRPARPGEGRPTAYEPRFCDELEAAMAQGYSATAFAGMIGVDRSTLDNWAKENHEFFLALSRGKAKRLLHWESDALRVAKTGGGPGTATIITFGLKNMGGDEWSDRQALELTGKDGGPIETAEIGARERIAGKIAAMRKADG